VAAFHIGAEGGEQGGDDRRVVGEADPQEDVRNGVDRQDEIGQSAHHDALGSHRRLGIARGIVDADQLVREGDAGGDATDLGPEADAHAAFVDFLDSGQQGAGGVDRLFGRRRLCVCGHDG